MNVMRAIQQIIIQISFCTKRKGQKHLQVWFQKSNCLQLTPWIVTGLLMSVPLVPFEFLRVLLNALQSLFHLIDYKNRVKHCCTCQQINSHSKLHHLLREVLQLEVFSGWSPDQSVFHALVVFLDYAYKVQHCASGKSPPNFLISMSISKVAPSSK